MDQETRENFMQLGDDVRAIHGKIDSQREDIHHMELAVQNVGNAQVMCRREMEPRMATIETSKAKAQQHTWDIVRPILTRAAEVAVFALIFAAYTYLKSKGTLP